MTKAIAVDFDGVIHKYSNGWQDGTIYDDPIPGAKQALLKLMKDYAVFVHTTRDVQQVTEWMNERLFPEYIKLSDSPSGSAEELVVADIGPTLFTFWNNQELIMVTNRKLAAVAYIDDRAVLFTNWDHVLFHLKDWINDFNI